MRKFRNFPTNLTLREINLSWFQRVKNFNFDNFGGIEFWVLGNFTLRNVKNIQKFKFRAGHMVKIAVFGASKWQKLSSHKIWVAEKSWNFHIVYSKLGLPGLYVLENPKQFWNLWFWNGFTSVLFITGKMQPQKSNNLIWTWNSNLQSLNDSALAQFAAFSD